MLEKANEELRQRVEKLKFFAASVVHDIRSPVVGIYGLTKILSARYVNVLDEKGMNYFSCIMETSKSLLSLVDKLNTYIASKETPLEIESIDICELLGVLRGEFSSRLSAQSINLIEPEERREVRADRLCLERMFRNLLDNALKYGGDNLSEIRIEYEELEGYHIFSVSNNGQGMIEKDTDKIFKIFQRSSASNKIEGAGLGLAIVKEIVERHGGRLTVKEGNMAGVTFYCSISRDL